MSQSIDPIDLAKRLIACPSVTPACDTIPIHTLSPTGGPMPA